MDLYYNHIVELIIANVGIRRNELFVKSEYTSKREFISEINRLLSSRRIEYYDHRLIYSPRVLYMVEINESQNKVNNRIQLKYLPSTELKKHLNFIESGKEPEDDFEYYLQIAGYELKEDHKEFMENYSNSVLSFDKFKYYLWAKYLPPFEPQNENI